MEYQEIITQNLLFHSIDQHNLVNAVREWTYNGEVIDHQKPTQKCKLCGHPIRYEYIITNKITKKSLGVGSECVGNYLSIPTYKLKKDLKHTQVKNKKEAKSNFASECSRIASKYLKANNIVSHRGLKENYNNGEFTGETKDRVKSILDDVDFILSCMGYYGSWFVPRLLIITRKCNYRVNAVVLRNYLAFNKKL